VLLRLLFTRVLPLAVISRWSRSRRRGSLRIGKTQAGQSVSISLGGVASEDQIVPAISCFEEALTYHKNIVLDLDGLHFIDARFLGLLLMLRKELKVRKAKLAFTGVSSSIMRIFRLNELEFLLASDQRD
jgi:N-acetylglucosaminyldiphosphoundecaprenol N-acetyl-beta-D-mannosaminyltransferase